MTQKRTPYPGVFWVANTIEILERFAYYGIYFGFGIYMESLGFARGELGIVQSIFLLVSYTMPVISGTLADKYGFKKMLIISYLAYLPTILLLQVTKSFGGIVTTMLLIGLAAGFFKPLIAGTVRAVTDSSNKTMGFGIFYMMVNVGASFGPIVAGKLRAISWNYAFGAAAIGIIVMLFITIFFYKEPPREPSNETLGQKLKEIGVVLSDVKFSVFLLLLGLLFWLPFWAFFNICAIYVDKNIDTAALYHTIAAIPLAGTWLANFLSHEEDGVRKILGETIAHTGYIILVFQFFVSKSVEKFKAMPSFMFGLFVSAIGFLVLGLAAKGAASLAFLGIFLFAVGEMISSPRIQEYITWMAPKEKAGLYMGTNFLATAVAGLTSGFYTRFYYYFRDGGNAEYIWYILAGHMILAIVIFIAFGKIAGSFEEQES